MLNKEKANKDSSTKIKTIIKRILIKELIRIICLIERRNLIKKIRIKRLITMKK